MCLFRMSESQATSSCFQSLNPGPKSLSPRDGAYKAAFLDGIAEHNAFGVAASNSKYQIDQSTSLELLGLRVPRLIHWVMLS